MPAVVMAVRAKSMESKTPVNSSTTKPNHMPTPVVNMCESQFSCVGRLLS